MKIQIVTILVLFLVVTGSFSEFSALALYGQKRTVLDLRKSVESGDKTVRPEILTVLTAYEEGNVNTKTLEKIADNKDLEVIVNVLALNLSFKQRGFDMSIITDLLSEPGDSKKHMTGLVLLASQAPGKEGYTILCSILNANAMSERESNYAIIISVICATYLRMENPYQNEVYGILSKYEWSDMFRRWLFAHLAAYDEIYSETPYSVKQMRKRCILEEDDPVSLQQMLSKLPEVDKAVVLKMKKQQLKSCFEVTTEKGSRKGASL